MRAKVALWLVAATLLAFGLFAGSSLYVPSPIMAQPSPATGQPVPPPRDLTKAPPTFYAASPSSEKKAVPPPSRYAPDDVAEQTPSDAVRDKQVREAIIAKERRARTAPPVPERPQADPLVISCTTLVAPIFENSAIGQPVPLTIEIRKAPCFNEDIPPKAWQQNLPDKVKEAVRSALAEAVGEKSPEDRRLDQVLDRLERIEKRLDFIARQKRPPDAK